MSLTGVLRLGQATLNVGTVGAAGTVAFNLAAGSTVTSDTVGQLNLNAGTLRLGNANFAPVGANVLTTLAAGTTLDLNGRNTTLAYLQGSGAVATGTNPAGTLTLKGAVYGGSISGAGGLTVATSSSVVLTGASAFTGATLVSGGTLDVFPTGSLGSLGGITVRGGGNLSIRGSVTTGSGTDLTLASFTSTPATANLFSGGTLSTTNTNVGVTAGITDTFTQDGGTHTAFSALNLGLTPGGGGGYSLSGANSQASQLTTRTTVVGFNGSGTFTQSGGTHTAGVVLNGNTPRGGLYLGFQSGASGDYTLSGNRADSVLSTSRTYVGNASSGTTNTFTQTGGTHSVAYGLYIGEQGGAKGAYTLSGTGQLSAYFTVGGDAGTGTFTQNGGTHAVGTSLSIGDNGGSGTYTLNGGTLTTNFGTTVGNFNATGVFNLENGTHTATLGVSIGRVNGTGAYHLDGGTLRTSSVGGSASGAGASASTFYFNGGTLQSLGNNGAFVAGLANATVQTGGAVINTAAPDRPATSVTVSQPLLHDPALGASVDGGLVKQGAGTLSLTGANTYTGSTDVQAGTLLANNPTGSATGPGPVTVRQGGTLGGGGTVSGDVLVNGGGTLAPGNSPGRLTLGGALLLQRNSTLAIEIGGVDGGTGYDQVFLPGQLTLSGDLRVSLVNGFTLTPADRFTILEGTGNLLVNGAFANAPGNVYTDAAGDTFRVNYAANVDGGPVANDVTLIVLTVVPEPGTWALLLAGGGAGLLGLARRPRHPSRRA